MSLCQEIWDMFIEHISLCESCNEEYAKHIGKAIQQAFESAFSGGEEDGGENET